MTDHKITLHCLVFIRRRSYRKNYFNCAKLIHGDAKQPPTFNILRF